MLYRDNLAIMASKSGGHDARSQACRGHEVLKGKALSASHINLPEKFDATTM